MPLYFTSILPKACEFTAVSVLWYFCRDQKYCRHNCENLLLSPLFCCWPSAEGHHSDNCGDYLLQHQWEHTSIPQLLLCSINFPVWPSGSHSSICTHHLSWDWSPFAAAPPPHSQTRFPYSRFPIAESQTCRSLKWFNLGAITKKQKNSSSWCLQGGTPKKEPLSFYPLTA